jgi:hypothetical protein
MSGVCTDTRNVCGDSAGTTNSSRRNCASIWQRLERMRESPRRVSAAWDMIVVGDRDQGELADSHFGAESPAFATRLSIPI